jgi:hypothetical protein
LVEGWLAVSTGRTSAEAAAAGLVVAGLRLLTVAVGFEDDV